VDVMAADNEGPIIAVDVGGEAGLTLRRREGERLEPAAPGAGNGAAQPWDEDRTVILPGLGEQLVRIVTLSSTNGRALAEKHAAVIIRPDDAGVGMLEFHMIDKMRSEGRKAARAALAAASNGTGT
jgi:predicted acylesterase/phospholipase RssA